MKAISHLLKVLVITLTLFTACSGKKSQISIATREIDFSNTSELILEGETINIPVIGIKDMIIIDSLIAFITNDQSGMLQVFSLNSMKRLGNYCIKGRAKNEFMQISLTNGLVKKNGCVFLPLKNFPNNELKLVNISQSISNGYTVIDNKTTDSYVEGSFVLLKNNVDNRFEYHLKEDPDGKQRGVPVHYLIREGKKTTKLEVFSKPIKYDNKKADYVAPYMGALYKHPERNLIIQPFMYTEYIFFFDIDNTNYYAIHKKGTESYEDIFTYQKADYKTFTDVALANDFFMVLYWGGKNNGNTNDIYPELVIFDWNGNYLKSIKLDKMINAIEYDGIHNVLYGINRIDDSLYSFNMELLIKKK